MASSETRVCDLPRSQPTLASPDESAGTAWDRMVAGDLDHLVVLREGRIVGMVSRADLSGPRGGTHRRMGRRVGELMRADVVTASSRTSVRRAADLMCRRKADSLLIVDRGRPTGLVTVWQVLAWLARQRKPAR
jgi:CBS domain-containing protein